MMHVYTKYEDGRCRSSQVFDVDGHTYIHTYRIYKQTDVFLAYKNSWHCHIYIYGYMGAKNGKQNYKQPGGHIGLQHEIIFHVSHGVLSLYRV